MFPDDGCRTFWVALSTGSWGTPFLKYASIGGSIKSGIDDEGDVMLNAPLGGIEGDGNKFISSGRNSSCLSCIMALSNYSWLKIVGVCFNEFVYVPTKILPRWGAYE